MPTRLGNAAGTGANNAIEWEQFKGRFIRNDGRVIDNGNGGISHSEGQGLGLLFAVAFSDAVTFDKLLDWTSANLRRRHDALHAWRFDPAARQPVADHNNATDGDIFIASALWQASQMWGRADHALAAAAIATDILRLLVRRQNGRTVMLPGAAGFETADGLLLNPSYYAFPMLRTLAAAAPSPVWSRLMADGLALIADGRFGRWMLPPDWLLLARADGSLSAAAAKPPRFSYDAIRIPLYLAWAGLSVSGFGESLHRYWSSAAPGPPPAWVDLRTGAVAPYPAPPGFAAVADMYFSEPGTMLPASFPEVAASADYYSAALTLLSRIAWQQARA